MLTAHMFDDISDDFLTALLSTEDDAVDEFCRKHGLQTGGCVLSEMFARAAQGTLLSA